MQMMEKRMKKYKRRIRTECSQGAGRQAIRVLGAMLRFAGGHEHGGVAQEDPASNRSLLRSAQWEPFAPIVTCANATQAQVYASTWPQHQEVYMSFVVVADRSAALGRGTVKAEKGQKAIRGRASL